MGCYLEGWREEKKEKESIEGRNLQRFLAEN